MTKKARKHPELSRAGNGSRKNSAAQTKGQFERDPKGRTGQFSAAGDPALTKK